MVRTERTKHVRKGEHCKSEALKKALIHPLTQFRSWTHNQCLLFSVLATQVTEKIRTLALWSHIWIGSKRP